MPATVSTKDICEPEMETKLRAAVEQLFKKYPDDWRVSVRGAQTNDDWELKVTASDGRRQWVHRLHALGGGQNIETILTILENINIELPPNQA